MQHYQTQQAKEIVAARERQLLLQWSASTAEMSELLRQVMSAMAMPKACLPSAAPPAMPMVSPPPGLEHIAVWKRVDAAPNQGMMTGTHALAHQPAIETASPPPGLAVWRQDDAVCKHEAARIEDATSTNDSGTRDFAEVLSDADTDAGGKAPTTTTLMVRNIPKEYTQEMLLRKWPLSLGYDFLYLPRNKRGHESLGYAFVNFVSEAKAEAFRARWHKRRLPQFEAPKKLNISLAEVQGFEANVRELKQRPGSRVKGRDCEPVIVRDGRRLTVDEI